MNAICTQCGKQFVASSTEDAYDPDRLCAVCYKAAHAVEPTFWESEVADLRQQLTQVREKLAAAYGADKPDKPATPTERARFWAVEAAAQKRRADESEAELAALRAEWEAIPTGALFDYWLGSRAVHPDAEDAAPEVDAWVRRLYDFQNGEGASKRWMA